MLLLVELASAPRRTGLRVARRDVLDLSLLRGKREKTLPDDKCDTQNHAWTFGLFASLCQLAEYTAHRAASIQPPACLSTLCTAPPLYSLRGALHHVSHSPLTRCIVTITLTCGASQIAGEYQTSDTAKCAVSLDAVGVKRGVLRVN